MGHGLRRVPWRVVLLSALAALALLVLALHRTERLSPAAGAWSKHPLLRGVRLGPWRTMPSTDYRISAIGYKGFEDWLRRRKLWDVCGPKTMTSPVLKARRALYREGKARNGTPVTCFDLTYKITLPCYGQPRPELGTYQFPGNRLTKLMHTGVLGRMEGGRMGWHVIFADDITLGTRAASSEYTGKELLALPIQDLFDETVDNAGAWNAGSLKGNATLEMDGADPVLRVDYPAQSRSGARLTPYASPSVLSGGDGQGRDSVVLAFDVFFSDNFDFDQGGKLFGGLHWGGEMASGLEWVPDGGSFRVMWLEDGAASGYTYLPEDNDARYAPADFMMTAKANTELGGIHLFNDTFGPGTLVIGDWNHVELGIKLNSSYDVGDGMLMLRVNDKTATYGGMRQTTSPEGLPVTETLFLRVPDQPGVHELVFNTFFGGDWASPENCHARFKNVALHEWTDPPTIQWPARRR